MSQEREVAEKLFVFFTEMSGLLRQRYYMQCQDPGSPLTHGQFKVLSMLEKHQPCPMSTLSQYIHVSPASLTTMINRLVMEGYIHRLEDTRDRRIILVELTEKGQVLLAWYHDRLLEGIGKLVNDLPEERMQKLDMLLTELEGIFGEV